MIKSIILISDAYPPSKTSAALQLRDLAVEFLRQGISPTVVTPDPELTSSFSFDELDGIKILRLKTARYKNLGNIRRALAEICMPFFMIWNFRKSRALNLQWDAIVWYSPTIFLGPFIGYIKGIHSCPAYLILRDIFPAWALDLGLIRKGIIYYLFLFFEKIQYSVADHIGIQTLGNLDYFRHWPNLVYQKVQVLQNWLTPKTLTDCSISVAATPIANRTIFVYAGNMGVAQGMIDLLNLAHSLLPREDIGFLFVGRSHDVAALQSNAKNRGLVNTVFYDEIEPNQIPGLYEQCHIGLIALDVRHKTHNIPGKFLSYLQSGLPVLAIINKGNDLQKIVDEHQVGKATSSRDLNHLRELAESIAMEISLDRERISNRCKKLADDLFSSKAAVKNILDAFGSQK